jgi:hypothetical protein
MFPLAVFNEGGKNLNLCALLEGQNMVDDLLRRLWDDLTAALRAMRMSNPGE